MRLTIAIAGLLLLVLGGAVYLVSLSARVSEAEIARRCRESEPRWESYQEDVKGLIGAAPTAENR